MSSLQPSKPTPRAQRHRIWLVACVAVGVALMIGWSLQRGLGGARQGTARPSHDAARCHAGSPCDAPDDETARDVVSDVTADVTASNQPKSSGMAAKSTTPGLVAGRLPNPEQPIFDTRSPRAEVAHDIAARESRAALLNQRLETQLTTMRGEIEQARAIGDSERQRSLASDLAILETQLAARRNWESARRVPHRP